MTTDNPLLPCRIYAREGARGLVCWSKTTKRSVYPVTEYVRADLCAVPEVDVEKLKAKTLHIVSEKLGGRFDQYHAFASNTAIDHLVAQGFLRTKETE